MTTGKIGRGDTCVSRLTVVYAPPMPQYRVQVTNSNPTEPVRDAIVNTFYLDTDVEIFDEFQAGEIADDVNDLWSNAVLSLGQFKTQIYLMSDPEPRRPIATKTKAVAASTAIGPREVALCLSYYSEDNVPRRRGRMYLGPWAGSAMSERPGTPPITVLGTLAQGLADLGGLNVQWVVHSPTTGEYHNVTHRWIDNEWDTIRSRGRKATTRNLQAIEG